MRQIRTRKVAAVAVLACCGLVACTSTVGADKGGSAGVADSARPQVVRSAEASTRAGQDWNELCVVAPLAVPDKWVKTVPDTQLWSDGAATAYQNGAADELAVEENGQIYQIFDGKAEAKKTNSATVEVRGDVIGNKRWIVFGTWVPSVPDDATVLWVWDRQNPQVAARALGRGVDRQINELQLRGDRLVWLETSGKQTRVRLANLATQSVSTLTQGKIASATLADENTVVWRNSGEGGTPTEIFDINTGKASVADNPIAKMATADGTLLIDGGYWVLADVETSVAGGDGLPVYQTWAWHPDWLDKKKVVTLKEHGVTTWKQPLRAGYLGIAESYANGISGDLFVANLATGYAQVIQQTGRQPWVQVDFDEDAIQVSSGIQSDPSGDAEVIAFATIPYNEVALPGTCVGSPD